MELERLLSDLTKIQSVNPPGGETGVAQYLKSVFDSERIPNEIIESAAGRASFLAHIGDGDRRLLYLSHLDVVPVSEGWDFPPFSGEIKDGYVRGRGAVDCKGLVAAEAHAMIDLARSGKLGGRLIFAATADEEAGGTLGAKYLVDNYRDKLMADFVINEGGGTPIRLSEKACYFIGVGEKGGLRIKLTARGTSAHSGLPMLGDNAVVKMARLVKGLAEYQPQIVLIPETKQMIREIVRLHGWNDEVVEANIDHIIEKINERRLAAVLSSVTRMTIVPNIIHGGIRGAIPEICEAEVGIGILPGQDQEYVLRQLGSVIGNVETEILRYSPPTFSTSDSEYYRLTSDALRQFIGDFPVAPSFLFGGTDSRHFRPIGIPCYGMPALTLVPPVGVHGNNEKKEINGLLMEAEFLTRLARRYLGN